MTVRCGIDDTKDDDQVQNTNADVYYSTETEYSLGKQNSLTYNYSFDWEKTHKVFLHYRPPSSCPS